MTGWISYGLGEVAAGPAPEAPVAAGAVNRPPRAPESAKASEVAPNPAPAAPSGVSAIVT